ncbi:MAG: glycosyltransferase family 2 protein [Anaerolineales bacterium]|nr:glycosyltransferase family 2 protein [Anaerolineales bacterium]
MKLSFIVITYQRGALLQRCLASIYAQEGLPPNYEVIVIDNGGDAVLLDPPTSAIQLHLESPTANLGVTGGRNHGMALAQGEYWVLIDDDAVWQTPNDVAYILHAFESHSDLGALAIKSLYPDSQTPIRMDLPHPRKRYIQETTHDIEVPYFYGVAHALRASAIKTIGNYPERFFNYMEEIDLSYRLVDAGYHICFTPKVAVYHYQSHLGRPTQGANYWRQNALNKSRMAWRLLPYPYPLTTLAIWSIVSLYKTRSLKLVWGIWRQLWQERDLLRQERHPLHHATIRYLKQIGARLLY